MKKFGLITLLIILAFVITGFLLPTQVFIERSITIDRPVTMMFEILNGYSHFKHWSPWVQRDPDAQFIVSGPDTGVGARLDWIGDPHLVGSGSQEIIASTPYGQIDIEVDFDVQGIVLASYLLAGKGDSTRVTWTFDTNLTDRLGLIDGFLARYFGLLFDRWVGRDYDEGLSNLKAYAESLEVADFRLLEIDRVDVAAQTILYVTSDSTQDPADIADAVAAAYSEISEFMGSAGIRMSGQPMAITRAWEQGGYQFDAAIPVDFIPSELSGNIKAGQSPSGPAVRVVHRGGLDQLMPVYEKLAAYMSAHGLEQGGVSWEHYISDPANTDPQDTVTHIYIMLDE